MVKEKVKDFSVEEYPHDKFNNTKIKSSWKDFSQKLELFLSIPVATNHNFNPQSDLPKLKNLPAIKAIFSVVDLDLANKGNKLTITSSHVLV